MVKLHLSAKNGFTEMAWEKQLEKKVNRYFLSFSSFLQNVCGWPRKINKIQKIRRQTNKQTSKQNFYPKYLSKIKSDFHEVFRVTSCGGPTMIKIKNKQINKQTSKYTNK